MLERLTDDPFEIVAVQPHDHGVSPGHSGVDGETLMLMSLILTEWRAHPQRAALQCRLPWRRSSRDVRKAPCTGLMHQSDAVRVRLHRDQPSAAKTWAAKLLLKCA